MANQTQSPYAKPQKEPKFVLGNLFVDANVVVEPAEPQKIVVAGMTEATVKKEYSDSFFKRGIEVFRGEYSKTFKSTIWFLVISVLVFAAYLIGLTLYQDHVLADSYNFMANIGIGYPGVGDSISQSVAQLYWEVYQPVLMFMAAAMIIVSPFMAGQFYAAKRSYYQDSFKMCTRTYWLGFAKHWWKFLLAGTVSTLVMLAMGTAMCNLLAKQQLAVATAGDYCGVVFSFIIGAPVLAYIMVLMGLFTTYDLSLKDAFKDALVIIANNWISVIIVGVLSSAPLLLLIAGKTVAIIVYAAMFLAGYNILALEWIALVDRGMTKCKNLLVYEKKKKLQENRKAQKNAYQGNPAKKKNKKTAQQPYVNPKKKKKK